jgi:hypothetical protein
MGWPLQHVEDGALGRTELTFTPDLEPPPLSAREETPAMGATILRGHGHVVHTYGGGRTIEKSGPCTVTLNRRGEIVAWDVFVSSTVGGAS